MSLFLQHMAKREHTDSKGNPKAGTRMSAVSRSTSRRCVELTGSQASLTKAYYLLMTIRANQLLMNPELDQRGGRVLNKNHCFQLLKVLVKDVRHNDVK